MLDSDGVSQEHKRRLKTAKSMIGSPEDPNVRESEVLVTILLATRDFKGAARAANSAIGIFEEMSRKTNAWYLDEETARDELWPGVTGFHQWYLGRLLYHRAMATWGNSTADEKFPTKTIREMFSAAALVMMEPKVVTIMEMAFLGGYQRRWGIRRFLELIQRAAAFSGDESVFEKARGAQKSSEVIDKYFNSVQWRTDYVRMVNTAGSGSPNAIDLLTYLKPTYIRLGDENDSFDPEKTFEAISQTRLPRLNPDGEEVRPSRKIPWSQDYVPEILR